MPQPSKIVVKSGRSAVSQPVPDSLKEMTILDFLGILSRRRWIVLGVLLSVVSLAAFLFITSTRLYKASAEIQVQRDTADALSLNNMIGPSEAGIDAEELNMNLQTQAQILQSDSLALQVIRELDLEKSPDFRSRFSPLGWVMGLLSTPPTPDPKGVPLEDAPGRRSRAITIFQSRLKVQPRSGTHLIDISYLSDDPRLAAAVVNNLVHDLSEYNFQTRHNATQEAGAWLENQLSDLRAQSDALQARVADLRRDSGAFTLGQSDNQGHEQIYTPALDRLQQATSQLEQAESARIMKGALYQVVKGDDPELISGIAGSSMLSGTSSGVAGSLSLLQNLREQEAQTQAKLNELSAKFGPEYPKLTEVRASLESTEKAINGEAARIAARVKNDYIVSQQVEAKDRDIFAKERAQADALNDKAVEYEAVRDEAKQSRNLYESLRGRLKEADLVAGLRSSNITLVDPARPASRPAKPNLLMFAGGGICGGLGLGIGLALFWDATDSRIQDLAEMEALCLEDPIGFLPYYDVKATTKHLTNAKRNLPGEEGIYRLSRRTPALNHSNYLAAFQSPHSTYTEALRSLRTSLTMNGQEGLAPQVILVTSSVPGEGKSMLCANLAIVFAQRGKSVLLVDADLRTPLLSKRLNLTSTDGLSSFLAGKDDSTSRPPVAMPIAELPSLKAISAGPVPTDPTELLDSDRMSEAIRIWRKEFDYILFDSAPILPVTDSALLSRHADFTLVVARHRMTDWRSLQRTCQILRPQGPGVVGAVLNGVKRTSGAQYGYYGYGNLAFYEDKSNG